MSARSTAARAEVGIIGGSGLYSLEAIEEVREIRVSTPFGDPSDALVVGRIGELMVAFIPRHGRGHRLAPAEIPARANIYALKSIGVGQVISVSAVGSLREDLAPHDFVVPDQIVDRTLGTRVSSFFGEGLVVHAPFADPFCDRLRLLLADAARQSGGSMVHQGGTYCCIDGPQFSTRAESNLYRAWGMDIIGMTVLPEAKLAREAELCYAALALVTDYDCWRAGEDLTVSATMVAEVMRRDIAAAKGVIAALVESLDTSRDCGCGEALAQAIMTEHGAVPMVTRERRGLLIEKYLATGPQHARPAVDARPP